MPNSLTFIPKINQKMILEVIGSSNRFIVNRFEGFISSDMICYLFNSFHGR